MGGNNPKSKIVAILDVSLHSAIDNGFKYQGRRLRDRVEGGTYYIEVRETGEILLEVPVT